MSQFNKHKR